MQANSHFEELLSVFDAHGVRYLVIGGYAVSMLDRPRWTKDLDVWTDPAPDNAARVWAALAEFGAPLKTVALADFEAAGTVYMMGVVPNRIDVLTSVEGVEFAACWERRIRCTYGKADVWVISREDLIRNKRAVGRPQDLVDADALERSDPSRVPTPRKPRRRKS